MKIKIGKLVNHSLRTPMISLKRKIQEREIVPLDELRVFNNDDEAIFASTSLGVRRIIRIHESDNS
jgi:hypothetical protein